MFLEKVGRHPDRLKNIYLVYAIAVRAINIVHEQLINHDYTTGLCQDHDQKTGLYMMDLIVNTVLDCKGSFNESAFQLD